MSTCLHQFIQKATVIGLNKVLRFDVLGLRELGVEKKSFEVWGT